MARSCERQGREFDIGQHVAERQRQLPAEASPGPFLSPFGWRWP
eukprot:CAMPEP_0179365794 /NCGR_PEP_ID=MMETSP0797-20121207/82728_1 /TAXON_ID=47934 /ORGANISM="Dinophysis acuminata, Strain DAEP01" /LENGTH=43 /DNA_ID= /DNA_START= /DNA_END= /DNA_ORIENTATION=